MMTELPGLENLPVNHNVAKICTVTGRKLAMPYDHFVKIGATRGVRFFHVELLLLMLIQVNYG